MVDWYDHTVEHLLVEEEATVRAYFVCNQYLSSVQNGIQALHVTSEMFIKYTKKKDPKREQLYLWAKKHKTTILLDGGYQSELISLLDWLDREENPYPFAFFREEEDALNGTMTSVGIVLPEKMYTAMSDIRTNPAAWAGAQNCQQLSDWEIELAIRMAGYSLAR